MIGGLLSLFSLATCYRMAQRSTGHGLGAVLVFGYFYGILRARFLDGFSHFIFDAAVIGFYLAWFQKPATRDQEIRSQPIKIWMIVLMGWAILVFLMPFNHYLVQLAGLRGAIFFLPFMLVGARATVEDLNRLSATVAWLNLIAFGFAVAEYFLGVERFYPKNSITDLIYRATVSVDGRQTPRIPAIFSSAHAFGGTMCATIPFLVNRLAHGKLPNKEKWFYGAAILASTLGIFFCASRLPVVVLFLTFGLVLFFGKLPLRTSIALFVLGVVASWVIVGQERMQRFVTLMDTEMVTERLEGSVNHSFLDALTQYPMGAGLGSAFGTSIPFFIRHLAPMPIGLENEFARILVEQGILGLGIWAAFLIWSLCKLPRPAIPSWRTGIILMHSFALVTWTTAFIGAGLLLSIPTAAILLFQMGLVNQVPLPRKVEVAKPQEPLVFALPSGPDVHASAGRRFEDFGRSRPGYS